MGKKYIPTFLRSQWPERIPIRYGIGFESGKGKFGMTHGPFDSVDECLECSGLEGSFILEIPKGTKLWKWSPSKDCWEEL